MKTNRGWLLLLGCFVIAQVAVPTYALTQPPPARFGFQMYSGYGEGSISVLEANGSELDVDYSTLLPRNLRPELDWSLHLPEHFCEALPDAATIVIEQDGRSGSRVACD